MRTTRARRAAAIVGAAVVLVGIWFVGQARANPVPTIQIGAEPGTVSGLVDFPNLTYADAKAKVQAGDFVIRTAIPGMDNLLQFSGPDLDVDDTEHSITVSGYLDFGASSPWTHAVETLFSAVWDETDAGDTDPQLALGIKIGDVTLAKLNGLFAPGIAGYVPDLASGYVVLGYSDPSATSFVPFEIDPARLPVDDQAFYTGTFKVDDVATLDADLKLNGDLKKLARIIGVNTTTIKVRGALASTAQMLYNMLATPKEKLATAKPERTVKDGDPERTEKPAAAHERESTVKLSLLLDSAENYVPDLTIDDRITLKVGGVTNTFRRVLTLTDASQATIKLDAVPPFSPPWDLGWTKMSDAALGLTVDGITNHLSAFMEATFDFADSDPKVRIEVDGTPTRGIGTISLLAPAKLRDVVKTVTAVGSPFATTLIDPAKLADIALDSAELLYTTDSNGTSALSLLAKSTYRSTDVTALLGVTKKPSVAPAAVVALDVIDKEAACGCVKLGSILPVGAGTVAAKLQFPALHLAVKLPDTSALDTSLLSTSGREHLKKVFADSNGDLPNPLPLTTQLQAAGKLKLDALGNAAKHLLGYGTGATVLLKGSLGLSMPDFAINTANLTGLDLKATLVPGSPPSNLPSWLQLGSNPWTVGVHYSTAESVFAVTASRGLTSTVTGTSIPITGTATLLYNATGGIDIRLRGDLGDWDDAFGVAWLDIDKAFAQLAIADVTGTPAINATVGASFTIAGKAVAVSLAVERVAPVKGAFTLSLADKVSVSDVITLVKGSVPATVPTQLSTATVGPATLRVTVDATKVNVVSTGTLSVTLVAGKSPINATMLLGVDETGKLLAGARLDGGTAGLKLSDILPSGVVITPDLVIAPPNTSPFAVVVATDALTDVASTSLDPLVRDWFAPLHGYAANDGKTFKVTVPAGATFIGNLKLPDSIRYLVDGLSMDGSAGIYLAGTLPVFDSTKPIALTLRLPALNLAGAPEWIHGGNLAMDITGSPTGASLGISGSLTVKLKNQQPVQSGTCSKGQALPDVSVNGTGTYCYDLLTFKLSASVGVQQTTAVANLVGSLTAGPTGWNPFGIEWVTVKQLAIKLGIEAGPTVLPNGVKFTLGLLGQVKVGTTDVLGAVKVGIAPLSGPPFATVTFEGIRLRSETGVSFQDLVDLQDAIAKYTLGASAPPKITLTGVPNMAVRRLELAYAPKEDKDLCMPAGIVVSGRLYVNPTGTPTGTSSLEGTGCPPPRPPNDPKCADAVPKSEGCFAEIDLRLDENGLIARGSMGAVDIGPLHWGSSEVDLTVTRSTQRFIVRGDASIDVDGAGSTPPLASGKLALAIRPGDFDFFGQVTMLGYSALVKGTASISALNSLSAQASMDVWYASKQFDTGPVDFGTAVASAVSGPINQLSTFVTTMDTVVLRVADLNLVGAKEALEKAGVSVPQWVSDLIAKAQSTINALKRVGILPSLDTLLNGYAFKGTTIVPGVCGVVFPGMTSPCTLEKIRDERLAPVIETAIKTYLPGVNSLDAATLISRIRTTASGAGSLLALDCAMFQSAIGTIDNSMSFALSGSVLGSSFGWGLDWDFNNLGSSAGSFVSKFLQALGSPASATCSEPPSALFGANGPGLNTPAQPPTLSLALSAPQVNEGGTVTATASFGAALTADRTVKVTWGDGTSTSVTVAKGATSASTSHVFTDDNPTATVFDVYSVTAKDQAEGGTSSTKALTVRNVAPSAVTASATGPLDEGQESTLTVGFADPGTNDSHNVVVVWGDGAVTTHSMTAGALSLTAEHTYRDDDPSTTAADDAPVSVTVFDDDGGYATKATTVRVRNIAPSAVTFTPTAANEGAPVTYSVGWTDPGVDDVHTVAVDWGDGSSSAAEPAVGDRTVTVSHTYADDDPTATPADDFNVKVVVTDDDTGTVSATKTVRVSNVAPAAVALSLSATTINEHDEVTVNGTFTDPGKPDVHQVTIDWGDASLDDTVLALTTPARTFTATQTYGDNSAAGTPFTIRATVLDDDTGTGTGTATLTVKNVAPTAAIDETAAVSADGGKTFLTRAGASLGMTASSTDPGSDDLTFRWQWADGSAREDRAHRLSASADPLPSPTDDPRSVTDSPSHAWSQACLYRPSVDVVDDDNGASAPASTWVVVTGTSGTRRTAGYWGQQYKAGQHGGDAIDDVTLDCYLRIVGHMSTVFDQIVDASTHGKALAVLSDTGNDPKANLTRQLLAAWLNFSNGTLRWDELIDTDGDGAGDRPIHDVLAAAEAFRVDAGASRQALLDHAALLDRVNNGVA